MKKLNLTILCTAVYNCSIEVSDDMSLEGAIEYARDCIEELPQGELQHIPGDEQIVEEKCYLEKA